MPYIQLDDTQFPLRVGAVRVGAAGQAEIPLPGVADPRALAIVEVSPDHGTAIRRAHAEATVRVNGVPLGLEPAPLLHGDKIEIGTHELLYGDDRKAGSTQFIPNMGGAASAAPAASAARMPARPTAATGGRLVSLVDGREYLVPESGITIGRDAGCDVVVGSSEVSRRHAELTPTADGYVLRDISTNGVWVNGTRVQQAALLGRADVLRIGGEDFRFYADAAPMAAPAGAAPGVPDPIVVPAPGPRTDPLPAPTPAPSPIPDPTPAPTPHTVPAPAAPAPPASAPGPTAAPTKPGPAFVAGAAGAAARAPLATLEVTSTGVLNGQRYDVRHPLANVGRGDHNDIVIADESVSDSHAKLQKREGRWYVVDVQSTNGTYVGGQRVTGEREIAAGADVRFGGVKLLFSPVADLPDAGKGTRVIAGASLDGARAARPAAPARPVAPARPRAPEPEPPARGGWSTRTWVLLVVTIGALAYLLLQGR